MRLTADQELRRELLQFALGKQPDIGAAIEMASRMEKFVLAGQGDDSGTRPFEEGSTRPIGATASSEVMKEAAQSERPCQMTREVEPPACGYTNSDSALSKRRWSSADDTELKRMWHSALQLEEIAEQLNRTVPSLYSRARALGYGRREQMVADGTSNGAGKHGVGAKPENAAGATAAKQVGNDAGSPAESKALEAPKMPRGGEAVDRYATQPLDANTESAGGWRSGSRTGRGQLARISKLAAGDIEVELGIEPIIHFLRSRDYSVVRVEDGRFRIDGRCVMDVDQLRDKANKVRKSLGLPPFAQEFIGAAE
jgi:hypothetical protein